MRTSVDASSVVRAADPSQIEKGLKLLNGKMQQPVGRRFDPCRRRHTPVNGLSEIVNFALWMRKEGFKHSTCYYGVQTLKTVARNANLYNPEAVKDYLAKATCSESRKERIVWELIRFYKWKNIPFNPPHYRPVDKLPFIPLEAEIDALISGCGTKTACLLQLLKETAMRAGEAYAAKWTDLDLERNQIIAQPAKGSRSRILKVSSKLISMLNRLPKTSQYVFRLETQDTLSAQKTARRNFERQRKRLATKLQNPRLLQIHLHSFRHYFATLTYNRTRDILFTMKQLGHHNIMHTLRYTQLVDWPNDQYVCKIAQNAREASSLIESGFEFVTDFQDAKLFRKRK